MEAHDYFRDELRRLRDRMHKVESTLRAVELFGGRLEHIEGEMTELREQVRRIATADAIADAVAARVSNGEIQRFTRLQAWGIRVAIVSAIVAGMVGVMEVLRIVLG